MQLNLKQGPENVVKLQIVMFSDLILDISTNNVQIKPMLNKWTDLIC